LTATHCWVVGRGGLLGRHVETSLATAHAHVSFRRPESPIRWQDTQQAITDLGREAAGFFGRVARTTEPWRLLWCAGAGVVPTSAEAVAEETATLKHFLGSVADRLTKDPQLAERGTLFFASSAGGVYAASSARPPFDETSPATALAPYGREKLLQEDLFKRLADECGVRLLIGRLSNLYGPGQTLSKPQGLIAHVGDAALRREPVSIYVPLDTIRDYLFAPDAGRIVVAAIERHEATSRHDVSPRIVTKIFASEVETTVATVLGTWGRVLRRPLRVALAGSPAGRLQPRVLSFRSAIWPDLHRQPTLLLLGIDAVRRDQLARLLSAGVG
jgi:nucleoside-diphosphate-sugar epimerase